MTENIETTPLSATSLSPSACHLLEGLDKRWKKFSAQLDRCQQEFGEEPVHDLRVASRRLLATLAMCKVVEPSIKIKAISRDIKSHLDVLDNLRDMQVMILFIKKNFKKDPAIVQLLAFMQKEEIRLIRKASRDIGEIDQQTIELKISNIRSQLEAALAEKDVTWHILSAVDEAYAAAIWRKVNVNPNEVASIHKLRIAFKKFRYMVEIAAPLVADMPARMMKTLQNYQGMMGNIQDIEVMLAAINEFAAKNPTIDVSAIQALVSQKHTERIALFLSRINQINRFWRKSPVAKFPWKPVITERQV